MTTVADIRPVLITGASSGIGLELARHYARAGRSLILIARNAERLTAVATQLAELRSQSTDDNIVTLPVDVADAQAVSTKLAECVHNYGVPDLVINAAGIVNVGRFLQMDKDYFDDNLRIDFEGTVNVCRIVVPLMVQAGSGHIVNIASVAGFLGIYGYTGYSAAKYAVMGFSEALRFELKPLGVAVSVVCPPDTKTPGFAAEQAARPFETEAIAGSIAPLNAQTVVRKIIKGIELKRFYIIVGASSKFYFRLKGLLPEVFLAIVDSDIRKAQREAAAKKKSAA
ncbi:MAG: SDR family oxidoreductase [Coriobacteriia bacterium]|nr:SDR family oxidoreductase [Coriobacteriia bacterium]